MIKYFCLIVMIQSLNEWILKVLCGGQAAQGRSAKRKKPPRRSLHSSVTSNEDRSRRFSLLLLPFRTGD